MYQLTNIAGLFRRLSDGGTFPAVESNATYAAYLAWLAQGNEPLPAPAPSAEEQEEEKRALLAIARANREIVFNRLLGHRTDCEDWLKQAQDLLAAEQAKPVPDPQVIADQQARITLETSNLAAIADCRLSLKNIMADPRIVAAVDGEAKTAVIAAWLEIVSALWLAAPTVVVAFKELDAL